MRIFSERNVSYVTKRRVYDRIDANYAHQSHRSKNCVRIDVLEIKKLSELFEEKKLITDKVSLGQNICRILIIVDHSSMYNVDNIF